MPPDGDREVFGDPRTCAGPSEFPCDDASVPNTILVVPAHPERGETVHGDLRELTGTVRKSFIVEWLSSSSLYIPPGDSSGTPPPSCSSCC